MKLQFKNCYRTICCLLLAAALCLAAASPAWAITPTRGGGVTRGEDGIDVSLLQLTQNKIDLANIDMTKFSSEKFVLIEQSAMEYAAQQDMQIGIVTNYVTVRFPAKAIVSSAEWTKAKHSSANFNFIVELDDVHGFDLNRDFRNSERTRLACQPISQEGVELTLYTRGSNNAYVYLTKLDADITIIYNYISNYRNVNSRYKEETLGFVWSDTERRLQSTVTTNDFMPSRVDVANQTVETRSPYACGAYVLVTQLNRDNRQTVFQEAASPAASGLTGQVDTSGVPAWAAADVGQLQAALVLPTDLSGVDFNGPIGRGELTAYLVRVLRLSTTGVNVHAFSDVPEDHPYYKEIMAGVAAGLVAGQSADSFAPDQSITRQELAALLTRAMGVAHMDYSEELARLNALSDSGQVADWARGSVAACLNTGLLNGVAADRFEPQRTASWLEAAAVLNRLSNSL